MQFDLLIYCFFPLFAIFLKPTLLCLRWDTRKCSRNKLK